MGRSRWGRKFLVQQVTVAGKSGCTRWVTISELGVRPLRSSLPPPARTCGEDMAPPILTDWKELDAAA